LFISLTVYVELIIVHMISGVITHLLTSNVK